MSDSSASIPQAPPSGGVRFAPSPTGRFHVGNLRTAWVSQQFARAFRVPWVVRMEDIDLPRVKQGAREYQLEDMAALGLFPDILLTQSHFRKRHWDTFVRGIETGRIYPCDCSRKDVQVAVAELASAPNEPTHPVYSGHCRDLDVRPMNTIDSLGWRFRMPDASGKDDFIIARTAAKLENPLSILHSSIDPTFVPAYHWACAIDDFDGQYDLLVRGTDLSNALPMQRAVQAWLGELECEDTVPAVFHTSMILQNDGHRLEKRTRGVTFPELEARQISAASLVWKFQQSFDLENLRISPETGGVFSEQKPSLSLQDLGL